MVDTIRWYDGSSLGFIGFLAPKRATDSNARFLRVAGTPHLTPPDPHPLPRVGRLAAALSLNPEPLPSTGVSVHQGRPVGQRLTHQTNSTTDSKCVSN